MQNHWVLRDSLRWDDLGDFFLQTDLFASNDAHFFNAECIMLHAELV